MWQVCAEYDSVPFAAISAGAYTYWLAHIHFALGTLLYAVTSSSSQQAVRWNGNNALKLPDQHRNPKAYTHLPLLDSLFLIWQLEPAHPPVVRVSAWLPSNFPWGAKKNQLPNFSVLVSFCPRIEKAFQTVEHFCTFKLSPLALCPLCSLFT